MVGGLLAAFFGDGVLSLGSLVGIITVTDMLRALHDHGFPQVRQYMTAEPKTLEVTQSLLDAALLLRRSHLRHIPIVENGHLVGILTDRDVARSAPSRLTPLPEEEYNRVFEGTPVGKVMTKEPFSTTPDSPPSPPAARLHSLWEGMVSVFHAAAGRTPGERAVCAQGRFTVRAGNLALGASDGLCCWSLLCNRT